MAVSHFSCDTFVVLPPATTGNIIFGKNSDRPSSEVQEFIYCPATDFPEGTMTKCTYIEVDQITHTHATVLSKPAWMWGAEMGSNEHGVCVGNEAVFTKLQGPEDNEHKLLGMDLVRLALERGNTARSALDVITCFLEAYGQGGPCYEDPGYSGFTYHNSFLIADRTEAWVLETAGKLWAARRVTSGVFNISNLLTIGKEIDLMSANLKQEATKYGYWRPEYGEFDFAKAFSEGSCDRRLENGRDLMQRFASEGDFTMQNMCQILRDEKSGICMDEGTTGSQVSVLTPKNSDKPCSHWFTATPHPAKSLFKPFLFTSGVQVGNKTKSPDVQSAKNATKGRAHPLYKAHANAFERRCHSDIKDLLLSIESLEKQLFENSTNLDKMISDTAKTLFFDAVDSEMKLYK